MSRNFESRAPQTYERLCETRPHAAGAPAVTRPVGALARVLAASRPAGVFLCVGEGAGEAGAWVLDGMDLASRLVVVVEDTHAAECLRAVFDDDLRVTVHVQDAAAFLGDVRDHRFDLITDVARYGSPRLTELELDRLAPGAFFMIRRNLGSLVEMPAAAGGRQSAMDPATFVLAHLPQELGVTLLARRAPRPEARRRGGRRARARVTPLFSSRPRKTGD